MGILACFLLCSMIGGVSEILYAAVIYYIKARFGRTDRKVARQFDSHPSAGS